MTKTAESALAYLDLSALPATGRPLGEGGSARVYEATGPDGESVAVKILHDEAYHDPKRRKRFLQEGKALDALRDTDDDAKHIVFVLERIDDDRHAALVLPLCGPSLFALASALREGRVDRVVRVLADVGRGLRFLAKHHLVHQDIKPQNVLAAADPDTPFPFQNVLAAADPDTPFPFRLSDFGSARTTDGAGDSLRSSGGELLTGTPRYMAPDRLRDPRNSDARADLFSLGVLAYQLATGTLPFDADTHSALERQILHRDPPAPSRLNPRIPRALDLIISKLLRKYPQHRYQSAADLLEDLAGLSKALDEKLEKRFIPKHADPEPWVEYARRKVKDSPLVASLAAALFFLPGLLALALFMMYGRALNAEVNERGQRIKAENAEVNERGQRIKAEERAEVIIRQNVRRALGEASGLTARAKPAAAMLVLIQARNDLPRGHALVPVIDRELGLLRGGVPHLLRAWTSDDAVRATAFSPDGTRVALGGEGPDVVVCDAATGGVVCRVPVPGEVFSLAFHPDGKRLAVAGRSERDRMKKFPDVVRILAGEVPGFAWVFDTGTKAVVGRPLGWALPGRKVAFRKDGSELAVTFGGDEDLHGRLELVVSMPGGRTLSSVRRSAGDSMNSPPSQPREPAFASPDGRHEAFAEQGGVRLREKGGTVLPVSLPHATPVAGMAFSPDGTTLLTVAGTTARLWDLLPVFATAEKHVDISPDRVEIDHSDWGVLVHGRGHEAPRRLRFPSEVRRTFLSPGGRTLLVATSGNLYRSPMRELGLGTIAFRYDLRTLKPVGPPMEMSGHVREVLWQGDDDALILTTEGDGCSIRGVYGAAQVWRLAERKPLAALSEWAAPATAVAWSPSGDLVARGDELGSVRVMDSRTGKEPYAPMAFRSKVAAIRFLDEGRALVVGEESGTVHRRRVADGVETGAATATGGPVLRLVAKPDGSRLAAISTAGTVTLMDPVGWTVVAEPFGFGVVDVEFNGDSIFVTIDGKGVRQYRDEFGRLLSVPGAIATPPTDPDEVRRLEASAGLRCVGEVSIPLTPAQQAERLTGAVPRGDADRAAHHERVFRQLEARRGYPALSEKTEAERFHKRHWLRLTVAADRSARESARRADVLAFLHDFPGAIAELERALAKTDPDSEEGIRLRFYRGLCLAASGRWKEAAEALAPLVPLGKKAHLLPAGVALARAGRTAEARRVLEKDVRASSHSWTKEAPWLHLFRLALREGKIGDVVEKGFAALPEWTGYGPEGYGKGTRGVHLGSVTAWLKTACTRTYSPSQKLDTAEGWMGWWSREPLEEQPVQDDYVGAYVRAYYNNATDIDSLIVARRNLEKAAADCPEWWLPHFELGCVCGRWPNQQREAIAHLSRALVAARRVKNVRVRFRDKTSIDFAEKVSARILARRADAYSSAGDGEAAAHDYLSSYDLDPSRTTLEAVWRMTPYLPEAALRAARSLEEKRGIFGLEECDLCYSILGLLDRLARFDELPAAAAKVVRTQQQAEKQGRAATPRVRDIFAARRADSDRLLSEVHLCGRDFAAARRACERQLRLRDDPDARFRSALATALEGRPADALAELRGLPDGERSHRVRLLEALLLEETGHHEDALALLRLLYAVKFFAAPVDRETPEKWLALASVLSASDAAAAEVFGATWLNRPAVAAWTRHLARHPDDAAAYRRRGELLMLNDPRRREDLDAAVRLSPRGDVRALRLRARHLEWTGHAAGAAADFEAVLRADAKDHESRSRLGNILARLGRIEEARRHLRTAMNGGQELGRYYLRQLEGREARWAEVEKLLTDEPQDALARELMPHLRGAAGAAAASLGAARKALADPKLAPPEVSRNARRLALAPAADAEDWRAAAEALRRSEAQHHDLPLWQADLAHALLRAGQIEEAVTRLAGLERLQGEGRLYGHAAEYAALLRGLIADAGGDDSALRALRDELRRRRRDPDEGGFWPEREWTILIISGSLRGG